MSKSQSNNIFNAWNDWFADALAAGLYRSVHQASGAFPASASTIHEQYVKTLVLLQKNPLHPSLRLHPLRGKLSGLHSISINLRYRITMELLITRNEIVPINIGDHDAVY